jgi:hypothetical protein
LPDTSSGASSKGLQPPCRAISRLLGSPRGSPRGQEQDAPHRFLQPTLDTYTHERSISGHAAFTAQTAGCFPDRDRVLPCDARPPCDDPTPAGTRLTARIQLRPIRSQRLVLLGGRRGPGATARVAPPRRSVFDHARGWRSTSDAPCRFPRLPGNPSAFEKPESLPPPPHQRGRLSRSRTPSIGRLLPWGTTFAVPHMYAGARHRCRGLAAVDPASDAFSLSQRSRVGGLDPSS